MKKIFFFVIVLITSCKKDVTVATIDNGHGLPIITEEQFINTDMAIKFQDGNGYTAPIQLQKVVLQGGELLFSNVPTCKKDGYMVNGIFTKVASFSCKLTSRLFYKEIIKFITK